VKNVLTVDVEDWYTSSLDVLPGAEVDRGRKPAESVVRNAENLLRLLAKQGHTATFFVLGTVAEHYPQIVKAIAEAGHEVGLHSYDHRLVYEMDPGSFRSDLRKCRRLVEAAGASGPFGYRAPYWSITSKSLWALEVLAEEGIAYDASVFPISRRLYGIPGAPTQPHRVALGEGLASLWEFPPSTLRVLGRNMPFGGGGYLRLLPYWVVRTSIRRLNAGGTPAIIYLHPYELDPEDVQAPHGGRGLSYWFQRLNRGGNPRKIRRMLEDFEFAGIRDVFASVL
jgi:polysaccharide deacetylase family protein (PEP-CTERM system associated)